MGRARGRSGPQKLSKTLSNLSILLQRPATSFQPAGSIGWGEPVGRCGPQKHKKPVKYFNFVSEASHIIPAGPVGWAKPVGAPGPRNIRKTCQTSSICFRGQEHHSSQQDQFDGTSRGRHGPQKHSKTLSILPFLFQRPATSFQPAGSVGWAEPVGAMGPRNI